MYAWFGNIPAVLIYIVGHPNIHDHSNYYFRIIVPEKKSEGLGSMPMCIQKQVYIINTFVVLSTICIYKH